MSLHVQGTSLKEIIRKGYDAVFLCIATGLFSIYPFEIMIFPNRTQLKWSELWVKGHFYYWIYFFNLFQSYRDILKLWFSPIGCSFKDLSSGSTGVFIGASSSDGHDLLSNENPDTFSGYEMSGGNRTMLSNRLSYCFDLKGNCSATVRM